MNTMKKIIEDCYNMPYYKNHSATSGKVHNIAKHEDAIEVVLKNNGLTCKGGGSDLLKACYRGKKNKNAAKIRDEFLSGDLSNCLLKDGEYISQPCGTHNSPDFLIRKDDKVFGIEAKSSNTLSPVYNSGFPKSKYIYVFCSNRTNSTAVFLGKSVNGGNKAEKIRQEFENKIKEVICEYNPKLNPLMETGLCFYSRAMWNHGGGSYRTSYFKQPRRSEWLEEVKEFINE